MEKPDDGDLGVQHTLTLITEYARLIAANEIRADTAAKALLAAAVQIGLQGAARSEICAWLRLAADAVESGSALERRQ